MSEAKENDRIQAQVKVFKRHSEIVHLDALIKDGYVSGSFATGGSIITICLTPVTKVIASANDDYLILHSLNSTYNDYNVPFTDILDIPEVVGIVRKF